MPDFSITVGATRPSIIVQLCDADGPINLASVSDVKFYMSKNAVPIITGAACSVQDSANGIVRYDWIADDTAEPGLCFGQFELTYSADSSTQRIPDEGYTEILIQPAQ